jgi:hypothetical protein
MPKNYDLIAHAKRQDVFPAHAFVEEPIDILECKCYND